MTARPRRQIPSRVGLGKTRHIEVRCRKRIEVRKVCGDCNPAGVFPKPKSFVDIKGLFGRVNVTVLEQ